MNDLFRDRLIVKKSLARQAYEYALGLKNNVDFKKNTEKVFLEFANYIKENYPGVRIDTPKLREKSPKSIRGKIRRLELERLAKLYAIEGISKREEQSFIDITKKIIKEDKVKNPKHILQAVQQLLYENIEEIDVYKITELLIIPEINEHSQTAFLRILMTRIEKSNRKDKEKILQQLEEKYGEEAAIREKNPEADKLRSDNLKEIKQNQKEIKRLHIPEEYLKTKDLLAMRFVFAEIPEQINSKKATTAEEHIKERDNHLIAFTREFAENLLADREFLDKLGIELLPNAYKHKNKQNGYIAEHFKFYFKEHPEQIFELQLRTIYREDIAQVGEAAHNKRAGKKRELPKFCTVQQFYEDIKDCVPQYTMIRDGKVQKCTWAQNAMAYYQNSINFDTDEYEKIIQAIEKEQEKNERKGLKIGE